MHDQHDDPELLSEIEKLGYEPRDVPAEQTWKHAAMLYISIAVVMGLSWVFMAIVDRAQAERPDLSTFERRRSPEDPHPLLQSNVTAHEDIANLRKLERIKTDTAGWIDKDAGAARIPVDNAIELVLRERLPQRGAESAGPALSDSAEPVAPGAGSGTGRTAAVGVRQLGVAR